MLLTTLVEKGLISRKEGQAAFANVARGRLKKKAVLEKPLEGSLGFIMGSCYRNC